MTKLTIRTLVVKETALLLTIDRSESIAATYIIQGGALSLRKRQLRVTGWDQDEIENIILRQQKIINQGGSVIGAFVRNKLVGVASVENRLRGVQNNFCKMDILYVDRLHRNMGVGSQLVNECKKTALHLGAEKLYISATPTQNTVDYYLRQGAVLATEPDAGLVALEPDDIHMELDV